MGHFRSSKRGGGNGDSDSVPPASELLHGVETLSKRLIELNGEDEWMVQQSKEKISPDKQL
jgi:hypothetical protein